MNKSWSFREEGEVLLPRELLMDVRERSWSVKVGNHAGLVVARGGEMKESSGRSSRFGWIDGNTVLTPRLVGQLVPGSILVTRGIADNLVRSLSTFVR